MNGHGRRGGHCQKGGDSGDPLDFSDTVAAFIFGDACFSAVGLEGARLGSLAKVDPSDQFSDHYDLGSRGDRVFERR
jgi:hypothetical protein